MGPPQTDTWQFWNSIDFNLYIDWEQQVSGDYGTYLPFCKYCMSTIRSTIQRNHAASGATAVAISMLAEQIYFKVHEIMVAEVSEHTYQTWSNSLRMNKSIPELKKKTKKKPYDPAYHTFK
jgi:hypothetical protein